MIIDLHDLDVSPSFSFHYGAPGALKLKLALSLKSLDTKSIASKPCQFLSIHMPDTDLYPFLVELVEWVVARR